MCVSGLPAHPNFWPWPLTFLMAFLVENDVNTLFLSSNVVFDVSEIIILTQKKSKMSLLKYRNAF